MTPMAGKEKPDAPPTPAGERIAKVLSRAGIASRREAERLIELGEVKVNGKVITSPALNVTPADRITVRGEPVGQPEPPRLWLYYKPEGLVTSASDEKGRDTVFDHLPEDMPRVMSVGRLDLNSEGLLLLTNDGELKRRLELPSTGWLRKYRVRVNGNPTEPEIEPLRKGITIDGERFQPMEVKIDRHQGANAWLTVGLREGKNREIRRAMSHIGLTVNRLIRVSYGPFRLNELKPGEVEELKPRILREQLGLAEEGAEPKAKPSLRRAPRPAGKGTAGEDAAPARPKAPLKPGEGQRRLSEAWQKATRGPATKPAPERGEDRSGKPPARPGRAPARPGPRPKGPRGG
jgi:23S rRNA pseudouridine2605 synthase